jgi:hypothetical protein
LCYVSGTEQQILTSADNISFRDQVIQPDQFCFPALWPLMVSLSGGRMLFVIPCVHFRLLINTIRANLKLASDSGELLLHKYLTSNHLHI